MSTPQPERRTPRGSLVVVASLVLVWLVWLAAYLVAPDTNPSGQCSGIGFGCTPDPQSSLGFVAVLALVPLTALVLLVTLVVRGVRIGRGSPRSAWDVVVGFVLLAMALVVVGGTVAGAL